MTITAISDALTGERVVALSPENASEAATDWSRRPNLFPGRALTVATLQESQAWQAGHIAQRGQAFTPGVARGLEVGYVQETDDQGNPIVRLKIADGQGLAVSGEDVVLVRAAECLLTDLPVVAPPFVFQGILNGDAQTAAERSAIQSADPTPGAPLPRAIGPTLGQVIAAAPDRLSSVGILVLQPVTVNTVDLDAQDPCDRCPCGNDSGGGSDPASFEDWRVADGVRLLWYAWPQEWLPLPLGSRFRNELAHLIFDTEGSLAHGAVLPWESWGVPIALIGLDANWRPLFADRASVVRQGGRARDPRLQLVASGSAALAANSRLPALWQARIEQFAEQVAAAGEPAPAPDVLEAIFSRLPPCGLLPKNAVDLPSLRSAFFPLFFDVDAVPVPVDQLDLALRATAGLAPLNLSNAESVRILVPVPQAVWDPRLLKVESVAPEFQQTLNQFLLTRSRNLGQRQGLRNKQALLAQAITGIAPVVPAFNDDPDALEVEGLDPWGPPPATGGGHRSEVNDALHQHYFQGATATLAPAVSEQLYCWVYLDPDNPPSTLMLQWMVAGSWEHRAYWGDNLIGWGQDGTVSRFKVGDLPAPGEWVRVLVPAASVGVGGATVTGMAFTLYGGRAAFASTGATDGSTDREWFSGDLPTGAQAFGEDPWDPISNNDLWAPFEPAFSVMPNPPDPVGEVETFVELSSDPTLAPLSDHERAQLPVRGLQNFIAYLKSRADRADDLVDYSFVKVQTDIYRVRQLMLGTTAATRLAVSPALASIAQADTAVASQTQIASFLANLKTDLGPAPKTVTTTNTKAISTGTKAVALSNTVGSFVSVSAPAQALFAPTQLIQQKTDISPILKQVEATPFVISNAAPVSGSTFVRTTTIAQRLQDPPSMEARDYATMSRSEAVEGLLRLADDLTAEDSGVTPGLFAGLELRGLEGDTFISTTTTTTRTRPFADFINVATRTSLLTALRTPPVRSLSNSDPDESAYFSDTSDLSDHVVSLMRQLEARIKAYRDAIAACQSVLDGLNQDATALQTELAAVQDHLAEARHDVAVARALLAEETDRVNSINTQRSTVLSEQVRFLAFVRPREVDNLLSAPRRDLDPGLMDPAVPACLKDHSDIPDDLQDMLRVVREAPSNWFVSVPKLIDQLDRPDLLIKTLQAAQIRTQMLSLLPIAAPAPTQDKVAGAIMRVAARKTEILAPKVAAIQSLNLAALAMATWKGVREQAAQVLSLGDLIDGAHGRTQVAAQAAAEFDSVSRIAACLHAEFSGVLPSIRLDWAETLSEFDAAPNLRNLGSLARWSEIDYVDRRQMQSYVDWLFAQIDPQQPQGESMMNDVVRMCLLLASHAPVDRIIAGRLKQPVTGVQPGVRLPLTVFDPSRLRVGMQALMVRAGSVVARATVEDIGSAEVSARVFHTTAAQVDLGDDVRVQYSDAAAVSIGSVKTVMSKALF